MRDQPAWFISGGSDLRRDDFRDQIATFMADLGVVDRVERVRLYRFARGLLRLGLADVAVARDGHGRTQALLDLEAAIRDTERDRAMRAAEAGMPVHDRTGAPAPSSMPWPGAGRVLATLATRNVRVMMAKDPFAYLWMFLAPTLTPRFGIRQLVR